MKANGTPEKIYLPNNPVLFISNLNERTSEDDIEYTRTDVFIENVRGWLKDCATFTDMNGKKRIDKEMYKATVEDFVKYMKGEQSTKS